MIGDTITRISVTLHEMCKASCKHPSASSLQMNSVNSCSDGKSPMLYVKDDLSGLRFLVDTRSGVSVFPASGKDTRSLATDLLLQPANGSQIKTYGERKMTISLNNKQFQWKFIIAAVTQILQGADFLGAHSLLADLRGND